MRKEKGDGRQEKRKVKKTEIVSEKNIMKGMVLR